MGNLKNSEILGAILRSVYAVAGRRSTKSFAATVIGSIIKTLEQRYPFLQYVRIDEKGQLIEDNVIAISPKIDSIEPEKIGKAVEAIIRIDPQILFIDGGLLLNPLFLPSQEEVSSENEELFLEDIDLDLVEQSLIKKKRNYFIDFLCTVYFALELFRETERRKIPIIGIIKRPRGFSFFNNHFPDSVVLEKAAMPLGTKTKAKFVGSHPVTSKYDILWEKIYGEKPGIRFSDKEKGYLKEFYLKTVAGREPIRVQIPYWVDDKQAATLTFAFSDNYEGVPVPILKADALTCVSDRLLYNLHTKLSLKLNMRAKLEGLKPWETGIIRLKR